MYCILTYNFNTYTLVFQISLKCCLLKMLAAYPLCYEAEMIVPPPQMNLCLEFLIFRRSMIMILRFSFWITETATHCTTRHFDLLLAQDRERVGERGTLTSAL